MIGSLYDKFKPWSNGGSIWIVSDTHFDDADCHLMDPNWIAPTKHARSIAKKVHKNDTLIHLGDIGDVSYLANAWKAGRRPYMVLITGNHDKVDTQVRELFDEIYTGPVVIGEKLMLSHEPIRGLDWCLNIHGHIHDVDDVDDDTHLNLASNVIGYVPVNLADIIKSGKMRNAKNIHRITIDSAIKRKNERELEK